MLRSGYRLLTDEKREWKTGKAIWNSAFPFFGKDEPNAPGKSDLYR